MNKECIYCDEDFTRSEMEEWFYDHDNEWQNDLEIDHQQEDTDLDLIEWAYFRYHDMKLDKAEKSGFTKDNKEQILAKSKSLINNKDKL
jgi:antitoxin ParD1/3/4